jgi:hypothetical protein
MTAIATEPRRSLFAIGADLEALNDLLEECGGDITDPTVCAAVEAWSAELDRDRGEKLDRVHGLLVRLHMEAAAARQQSAEWADRAASREKRSAGLKKMLLDHLQRRGEASAVSAAGLKFAVQANGGKPALTVNVPAEELDGRFLKVTVAADVDAIRAAIEAGEDVPFARLEPRGFHLRVR